MPGIILDGKALARKSEAAFAKRVAALKEENHDKPLSWRQYWSATTPRRPPTCA